MSQKRKKDGQKFISACRDVRIAELRFGSRAPQAFGLLSYYYVIYVTRQYDFNMF